MKKAAVLGAGFSGLSAAWQIGKLKKYEVTLYEKNDAIGGLCGFYDFNGIKLDYGPHKIYSVLPGIMEKLKELGKDRLIEINKKHRIILRGKMLDYPVRLGQVISIFTLPEIAELSLSVLAALASCPFLKQADSYEGYCQGIFGKKIYEVVFRPLAEKIWGNPKSLSAEIAKRRIPTKNIYDLLFRALGIKKESKLTNAEIIFYPRHGFHDICDAMAQEIERSGGSIRLKKRPSRFIINNNKIETIVFDDYKEEKCDEVISSIPLCELIKLLFPEDKDIIDKANFIKMRHCVMVYLLVNKPRVLSDHWVFCADKEFVFSRISEQKLISDYGFPEDKTVICCDFTCGGEESRWKESDDALAQMCVLGLNKLKIIAKEDVADRRVVRIPEFYPSYESGYEEKRKSLFDKINKIENIICTGRLGLSDYYNVDHCLDMANLIAMQLAAGEPSACINSSLIEKTKSYRIVD